MLGVAHNDGAFLWPQAGPRAAKSLRGHPGAQRVALSPDGGLAATSTLFMSGIKVWDVATSQLLRELPDRGLATDVCFSPDGQWLTSSKGKRWAVGSWQPAADYPPGVPAYSADGKLLAMAGANGVIHLLETQTGKELAQLTDPHQSGVVSLTFSPDGERLIVSSNDSLAVHVWNLRT